MKKTHRFFAATIGSRVRIIGTKATGTVESLDVVETSEGAELFAKIRYKNRLTRYSRVSDLGVILPRRLHWLYPALDGNRSLKDVLKSKAMKLQKKIEALMEKFINSNLDWTLLVICGIIAAILILSFITK